MEGIKVHYVESIEEVLEIALPKSPEEAREDAEARQHVLADAQN
jgi:predicted ATP-dependent protease